MSDSRNIFSRKRKYLYGSILLSIISVIGVAFSMTGSDDFVIARREVLLRKIGDELLLQSGDSTSRVLPVKEIADNEYQITFENELTFQPDSLVNTIRRLLARDPLTNDYVVNVLKCGHSGVIFGYAISNNTKDDIVACKTRVQPTACYMINIKLKPSGSNTASNGLLLGSASVLAFVGFIFLRSKKPRKTLPDNVQSTTTFAFGLVLFDVQKRQLLINKNTIDLTDTETRLLLIFTLSPNEIITRSRLQKEIWEDQGVIVGRSLDMFISKLRKKLEADPTVRLANVHGKGYKLEIFERQVV